MFSKSIESFWQWFSDSAGRFNVLLEDLDLMRQIDRWPSGLEAGISRDIGRGISKPWQLLPIFVCLVLLIRTVEAQQEDHKHPIPVQPIPSDNPNSPVFNVHVQFARLMSRNTGWLSDAHRLYRSSDGGENWKDVSPPYHGYFPYVDTLFLDSMNAWVLCPSESDDADFVLESTVNGGETWTASKVKVELPPPDHGGPELAGNGYLAFSDRSHGWLLVDFQTGSAFSSAEMLETTDGGLSWHESKANPGFFGEIRVFPNGNLWAVDGYHLNLEVSRKGGKFHAVELPVAPQRVAPAAGALPSLPVFENNLEGYIAVTYQGGDPGTNSAAALFATSDGGHIWKLDRVIKGLFLDETMPTTMADSAWVLTFAPEPSRPSVIKIQHNEDIEAPTHKMGALGSCDLSFASPDKGWMSCRGNLSLTTDGGLSWKLITPRVRNGVLTQDPLTYPLSR